MAGRSAQLLCVLVLGLAPSAHGRLIAKIELDVAARKLLRADHGHLDVNLVLLTKGGEQDDSVVLVEQTLSCSRLFLQRIANSCKCVRASGTFTRRSTPITWR